VRSILGSERFLRERAPFAGALLLAFVLVATSGAVHWGQYAVSVGSAALTVPMALGVRWLPRRLSGSAAVPGLLFLLAVFLLRDAAGGISAGVGVLSLLPVCWVAVHGTRRELHVVFAGVLVFWFGPVLLVGGEAYPTSQLRLGVLSLVMGALIGFTVQDLVGATAAHARNVARVAAAARRISSGPGAREEICAAACDVSGAAFCMLFEPDADGVLRSTAIAGLAARPVAQSAERTAAELAFTELRPIFAADAGSHPAINRRLWELNERPASMHFEPVLRGDRAVGVLAVGWRERVRDVTTGGPAMIALLAADAAAAIAHIDLVEQLSQLAATDPLTGLHNRRVWDHELDATLTRVDAGRCCVAIVDLDHFKAYNDAHGHLAGDRLLKEAASAWRAVLRGGDVLARYGGEEFAVLLPDCGVDDAHAVVTRLRACTPAAQTCSAGLAVWDGRESSDALIGRADAALYAAKRHGRDQLEVA
jgi:diguanylate cyclase (GGDEF)-like protein